MKKGFRLIALVLALLIMGSTVGCSLSGSKKPIDTVVAKVKDEKILRRDVIILYLSILSQNQQYASSYGLDLTSDDMVETMQDSAVNELVNNAVLANKATELGITLTDAEKKEITDEVAGYRTSIEEELKSQAESEKAKDSTINVDARVKELSKDYVTGYNISVDQYLEFLTGYLIKNALIKKLEDMVGTEVVVEESEITDWYNNKLKTEQDTFTKTPGDFKAAAEAADEEGGEPYTYVPQNYVRVKNLLIMPETEIPSGYTTKTTEISTLSSELIDYIVRDETKYAAEITDLKAKIAQLQKEANVIRDTWLETARAKAEEVLGKVKSGEDFDKLIAEYGKDTGMNSEPAKSKGYVIGKAKASSDYVIEFKEASLALQNVGDTSGIFASSNGWHIVKLVEKLTPGVVPIGNIHDKIKAVLSLSKKTEEFDSRGKTWQQEAEDKNEITKTENNYRDIGKKSA